MSSDLQALAQLIERPVEALGYELVHVQWATDGGRRVLRVYIDAPGGILVDDCATVSEQLSVVLDVEDRLQTAYSLEVSSPGLDRPLVRPAHFQRFVGQAVRVVTHTHVLGRRRFNGCLQQATAQCIVVQCDGEVYELAYGNIESARLVPQF